MTLWFIVTTAKRQPIRSISAPSEKQAKGAHISATNPDDEQL